MMDATGQRDAIERAMMARVAEIYAGALRKALKDKKAFLRKLQAVKDGRIPASRHRSYVRLYDELKDLRDWQHK